MTRSTRSLPAALGILAGVLVLTAATPGLSAAQAADDTDVRPIDWSRFTAGKPADATSALLERFALNTCKYGVGHWYEKVSGYGPQTGRYLDLGSLGGKKNSKNVRPPGNVTQACAIVLALGAYDDAATGMPEATVRERTTRMLTSVARTHEANGGYWGTESDGFHAVHWVHPPVLAAWLLWDDLSSDDQELVRRMLEHEANLLLSTPIHYYRDRSGKIVTRDDTGGEELAWWAAVLGLAANMMPDHPNRAAWQAREVQAILSGLARPSDVHSSEVYHGKPLSQWLEGSNIDEDGTVTNHGIDPHPHYMASVVGFYQSVPLYTLAGEPAPQATTLNTDLVYKAFVDLGFAGGHTIYRPGKPDIYSPSGNDKGTNEHIKYGFLDLVAHEFGGDRLASRKGDYWALLHLGKAAELQSRFHDGRSNATVEEGGVEREHWLALWGSLAYLTRWAIHQGATFHNHTVETFIRALRAADHAKAEIEEIPGRARHCIRGRMASPEDEVARAMLSFMRGVPHARQLRHDP